MFTRVGASIKLQIFFVGILLIACGGGSRDTTNSQPQQIASNEIKSPLEVNRIEVDDDTVYAVVVSEIAEGKDWLFPARDIRMNWLTFLDDSVIPKNGETLNANSDLTEDLISNFIENNKTRSKFTKKFKTKIPHDIYSQEDDYTEEFRVAMLKRKRPSLRAVISLSKIGRNQTGDRSLVYVIYRPSDGGYKNYMMKYCLIKWGLNSGIVRPSEIRWISVPNSSSGLT